MLCSDCTEPAVGYVTEGLRPYCSLHLEQMVGAGFQEGHNSLLVSMDGRAPAVLYSAFATGAREAIDRNLETFLEATHSRAEVQRAVETILRASDAAFLRGVGIKP